MTHEPLKIGYVCNWYTVIGEEIRRGSNKYMLCKCKCGSTAYVSTHRLRNKITSACYTCSRTTYKHGEIKDLIEIGTTCNWLTIIGEKYSKGKNYYIKARCRCGRITDVPSHKFTSRSATCCISCANNYRAQIKANLSKNINQISEVKPTATESTNMVWNKILDLEPKMNQKCVFTTMDKHVFEGIFLYKYDEDLYGFFRNKISAETFTSITNVTHWIDINNFFDLLYKQAEPQKTISQEVVKAEVIEQAKPGLIPYVINDKFYKRELKPAERIRTRGSEEYNEFARQLKVGERFKSWTIVHGPMDLKAGKRVNIYYQCTHDKGHTAYLRASDLINDRVRDE